jgi:type I restriction enzyme S subunit
MWTCNSTYKYAIHFSENRPKNDNLEQQAQALYKSWFVDFKPFKDGGFIDSELGEIPEGWKILPFVDFLILSNRKTEFDNIPEYSVTNTGIFPREEKFNKKLSSSTSKNKLINRNDLVFGMSREILNWGIMEDDIGGVSSAYTVYNIDYNIINPIYLKLFIQSRIGRFKDLIRPAAREGQGIDKQRLMSKYIYLPTSEILNNFWRVYDKLMESKENFTQETQNLTQVRDSLLPKLMSGELKINDLHS